MAKLNIGKKYYHSDPGHGWLAVKRKELDMLGIADKITSYSYVLGKTVYLEEDVDMITYINAVKAAGIDTVEIKKAKHWTRSNIRGFKHYNPTI